MVVKKKSRTFIGVFFMIFSVIYFYLAREFPSSAKLYPQILAALLFVLSCLITLQGVGFFEFIKSENDPPFIVRRLLVSLLIVAFVVSYVIFIRLFSFIPVTMVFLFIAMRLLGIRATKTLVFITVPTVLIVYYGFSKLLHVPLP